jgi:type II secretory pathway component PulK
MGLFIATPLNKQRGSAIVFAMGLSLLVVALSAALLLSLSLDIRRVEQLFYTSERLGIIESVEAVAASKISKISMNWDEPWEMQVGEARISAELQDLSARLNVNALFARPQHEDFEESLTAKSVLLRLFTLLSVSNGEEIVDEIQAKGRALFGLSQIPALSPAEDFVYLVDPDVQQVNINTTSAEVLASILDLTTDHASAILHHKPFKSIEDFHRFLSENESLDYTLPQLESWFSVEGRYYLLEMKILQKRSVRIYSVFQKSGETVTLEWRSWEKMP